MFMDPVKMATTRKYVVGLLLIFIVEKSVQQFVDGPRASVSSDEATISWKFYNPFELLDYAVFYTLSNKDQCNAVDERVDAEQQTVWGNSGCSFDSNVYTCSMNINDLVPYSTYSYYVKAQSHGPSYTSREATFRTNEAAPSEAPSNIKLTSSDLDSLSFSWDQVPCGSRHTMISQYHYVLRKSNGMLIVSGLTTIMYVTIDHGLSACMLYEFRVRASSGINLGPFNDEPITSVSVSNLYVNSSSSTSLYLSWEQPCNAEYGIEYRLIDRDQCQMFNEVFNPYGDQQQETSVTVLNLYPYSTYEVRVSSGGEFETETAVTNEGKPTGPPIGLEVTNISNTSLTFTWSEPECTKRNGVITGYSYSLSEGNTPAETVEYTSNTSITYKVLSSGISYKFVVSAYTSVGDGPAASLAVVTDGADNRPTDIEPPEPPVLKTPGPSVIIEFDVLPKHVSNVLVAIEYVPSSSRNKRQGSNLDGASNSIIVANLTRSNIEESMSFILGDNKTYGGYINRALIAGAVYTVRVAYASCTPVAECVVVWSPISIITAPDCMIDRCGKTETKQNSGATIGGSVAAVAVAVTIVIIAIVTYYRRQQSSQQTSPTSNETYDEIDSQIAKKSAKQNETGYEVNLAMEGIKTSNQYEEDYEDVKRESAYQEMNTGNVEAEHTYQGLGETEQKNESDYQGLSKANMDKEHDYQDLGQKSDNDRKTSIQYVNVAI